MTKRFKAGLKYHRGYIPLLYAGSNRIDLIIIAILIALIIWVGFETDWRFLK